MDQLEINSIVNDYLEFLEDKELENNENSLNLYITAIWYDLLNDYSEHASIVSDSIEKLLKRYENIL